MTTPKAISVYQLSKRSGMTVKILAKEITRAKLVPVMETAYGRGTMRLYDMAAADAMVAAYLKRVEAGKKRPEAEAAPVVSLTGVETRIGAVAGDVKVAQEAIDALTTAHKAFGKLMFEHLQGVEKKLDRVLAELGVKA